MVVYPAKEWELIRYEKSKRKGKKLDAILQHKKTGKTVRLPFGQSGSNTYRNTSGIETSDPIHNDPKIRANYRSRHKGEGDPDKKYSPGWLSFWVLW